MKKKIQIVYIVDRSENRNENIRKKSNKSVEWSTPADLYNELDQEFHFEYDLCATPQNAKAEKYYTKKEDGLKQEWKGTCFANPPYGRGLNQWVEKAYNTAMSGEATTVMLLPVRSDTAWFHDFCLKSNDIRYIRGRLKFSDSQSSAPFSSMVVTFSKETLGGI